MVTGVCNLVFVRIGSIVPLLSMIALGQYLTPIATLSALFLPMVASIWIETRHEIESSEPDEAPHLTPCEHAPQATIFEPRLGILACEECVKNNYKWVHLRLCMSCGHVGCCDSSKYTHATNHFHESSHSIMSSLEELETWARCYDDESFVPMPISPPGP